jgi:hypothetical protein
MVVNLSNIPLYDAMHSALCKGFNFTVCPSALPIEDILGGVVKASNALLKEAA